MDLTAAQVAASRGLPGAMRVALIQLGLIGSLAACTEFPMQRAAISDVASAPPAQALSATQVLVYPGRGQSAQQLDRDRYECYLWAVEQTRFDPSQVGLAPHQRTEIVAMPAPGADAAAGALAGATIGAVVSRPHHAAEGAIVGAVLGGLAGAAAEAARASRDEQLRRLADEHIGAELERQSSEYRRALTACLEGRGYTVK